LVVLHVGDEALDAVASAALVVAALSKDRLSNIGSCRFGDFNVVGPFAADVSVALVAAKLNVGIPSQYMSHM
jgi:hypothetical protein